MAMKELAAPSPLVYKKYTDPCVLKATTGKLKHKLKLDVCIFLATIVVEVVLRLDTSRTISSASHLCTTFH
jgi:hypothetical protein